MLGRINRQTQSILQKNARTMNAAAQAINRRLGQDITRKDLNSVYKQLANLFSQIQTSNSFLESLLSIDEKSLKQQGLSDNQIQALAKDLESLKSEVPDIQKDFNNLSSIFLKRGQLTQEQNEELIALSEKTSKLLESIPDSINLELDLTRVILTQANKLTSDLNREIKQTNLKESVSLLKHLDNVDSKSLARLEELSVQSNLSRTELEESASLLREISKADLKTTSTLQNLNQLI